MLNLIAHAVQISYRFPLPIWIYVLAGGPAVLASAPAALRRALVLEIPLVLLMVAYTMAGLWVLAQQIKA